MPNRVKIDGVRLIRPHNDGCGIADEPRNALHLTGETVNANWGGARIKGNGYTWLVLQCNFRNHNGCEAEIWIRRNRVTRMAHEFMQQLLRGRNA